MGKHCNRCSHSKKHSSNHLTVHHWLHSAIHDSRQRISRLALLYHTTLNYSTLRYLTANCITSQDTTLVIPPRLQLQLHCTNYTTPQLHLPCAATTTTTALQHSTSSSWRWDDQQGDHCNHCSHSKKHSSNHLTVHQRLHSAMPDSQQPTLPIGFLFLQSRAEWDHNKATSNLTSSSWFRHSFQDSVWHSFGTNMLSAQSQKRQ